MAKHAHLAEVLLHIGQLVGADVDDEVHVRLRRRRRRLRALVHAQQHLQALLEGLAALVEVAERHAVAHLERRLEELARARELRAVRQQHHGALSQRLKQLAPGLDAQLRVGVDVHVRRALVPCAPAAAHARSPPAIPARNSVPWRGHKPTKHVAVSARTVEPRDGGELHLHDFQALFEAARDRGGGILHEDRVRLGLVRHAARRRVGPVLLHRLNNLLFYVCRLLARLRAACAPKLSWWRLRVVQARAVRAARASARPAVPAEPTHVCNAASRFQTALSTVLCTLQSKCAQVSACGSAFA